MLSYIRSRHESHSHRTFQVVRISNERRGRPHVAGLLDNEFVRKPLQGSCASEVTLENALTETISLSQQRP